jgi:hypothetical protein
MEKATATVYASENSNESSNFFSFFFQHFIHVSASLESKAMLSFATAIIAALILQTQGVSDASHNSIASSWSCRCPVCKPCGKDVDRENVGEYSCECSTYGKRLRSETGWACHTYPKGLISETVRRNIRCGKLSTSITA